MYLSQEERLRAQRRAAPSSNIATLARWASAYANTALSPLPKSQARMVSGMEGALTNLNNPLSSAWRAGSSSGATDISSATACGSAACSGSRANNSTCPTRANEMTGEALMIHFSATGDFCDDFIGTVLKRRYFELVQSIDKFGAR
jgi:hypothetical protein